MTGKIKNKTKPDIKERLGFLSVAGWVQSKNPRDTRFMIQKSIPTGKPNNFKMYKIILSQPQLFDLYHLVQTALEINYDRSRGINVQDEGFKDYYEGHSSKAIEQGRHNSSYQ